MKRYTPDRSLARYAVWSVPLTVLIAGLIWQFGWLPVTFDRAESGKVNSSVANGEFDPRTGDPLDFLSQSAPLPLTPENDAGPIDPLLFASQSEPAVEEDVDGGNRDALLRKVRPGTALPARHEVTRIDQGHIPVDPAAAGLPAPKSPNAVKTAGGQPPGLFRQDEWMQQSPAASPQTVAASRVPQGTDIRQIGNETVITPDRSEKNAQRSLPPSGEPSPPFASSGQPKPGAPPELAANLADIDRQIREGNELVAHRELSKIYWSNPEWRDAIAERIDGTARSIYFSPQPHYMEAYVVQPGDQLAKIARQYKVPWEYLARLNRIDPRKIRPDQKLKVIKGPFSAYVEVSRFELTIHAHGYYLKRYRIGVGKDNSTPIGAFRVLTKLTNPTYYPPEGGVVQADDPTNPLGERWIDIGDHFGIHGTIDPESIGKAQSRGCIRLLNSDVEEVYDFLELESEVVINR